MSKGLGRSVGSIYVNVSTVEGDKRDPFDQMFGGKMTIIYASRRAAVRDAPLWFPLSFELVAVKVKVSVEKVERKKSRGRKN